MKRFTVVFARLVVVALSILWISGNVPGVEAQTKSFKWANWDVDITVQPNGDLAVIETQTLSFAGAPFTFGYRSIPVGRAGNNDGITDVRVFEGDAEYVRSWTNQPGTFEVVDEGSAARINWYFEPSIGSHTYTFSYTVKGAVRAGPDDEEGSGDQVYWTVIPPDIPSYVQNTTATIHLPDGIQPQKYTGTDDYLVAAYINNTETSEAVINVSESGEDVAYALSRTLAAGERFDVRVQWARGALPVTTPSWQASEQREDAIGLAAIAVSLLLLVGGPLSVLLLWYLRGRDPQLGVAVPEYITEPPDDLPPAMAGALIDEQVDMQDIVSTLVNLADRGYVTMEEEKKGFRYIRTEKSDHDLRKYEQTMLRKFFGKSTERDLQDLQYKFASNLGTLREQIYAQLVEEKLVPRSPHTVRTLYGMLAFGLIFVGMASVFVMGLVLSAGNLALLCLPAFAIFITALALSIAARHMPTKTLKGTESAAKWNAFKEYLKNIERYSDLSQKGEVFGRYLGYAVAFGLERSYIQKFSSVPTTPTPPWYTPFPPIVMTGGWPSPGPVMGSPLGGGGSMGVPSMPSVGRPSLETMSGGLAGGLAGMSAGLTRMLNSTSSVLKSTPPPAPSRSTGGFGGGGFSGGGFSGGFSGGSSGGGGGGGFG